MPGTVPTPAFLPVVVVVPIPTAVPFKNEPSFELPPTAVMTPVTVAPELFACIFTLPPESLILVASIPAVSYTHLTLPTSHNV